MPYTWNKIHIWYGILHTQVQIVFIYTMVGFIQDCSANPGWSSSAGIIPGSTMISKAQGCCPPNPGPSPSPGPSSRWGRTLNLDIPSQYRDCAWHHWTYNKYISFMSIGNEPSA